MVTLNCPNLHFSIPQEDILNDNSSEAMLQSCQHMSGMLICEGKKNKFYAANRCGTMFNS